MFFSKILKNGYAIRIENDGKHTKGYTPTTFRYHDGGYYFDNADMIKPDIRHDTMTDGRFNIHIDNMIQEGFKVIIFTE